MAIIASHDCTCKFDSKLQRSLAILLDRCHDRVEAGPEEKGPGRGGGGGEGKGL